MFSSDERIARLHAGAMTIYTVELSRSRSQPPAVKEPPRQTSPGAASRPGLTWSHWKFAERYLRTNTE